MISLTQSSNCKNRKEVNYTSVYKTLSITVKYIIVGL